MEKTETNLNEAKDELLSSSIDLLRRTSHAIAGVTEYMKAYHVPEPPYDGNLKHLIEIQVEVESTMKSLIEMEKRRNADAATKGA